MGVIIPFWGVLLAPPLLAVIYAYRGAPKRDAPLAAQRFSEPSEGIILPPEERNGG
jgi:hypothetical protein